MTLELFGDLYKMYNSSFKRDFGFEIHTDIMTAFSRPHRRRPGPKQGHCASRPVGHDHTPKVLCNDRSQGSRLREISGLEKECHGV